MVQRCALLWMCFLFSFNLLKGQAGLLALDNTDLEVVSSHPAKVAMNDRNWSIQLGVLNLLAHTDHAYLANESLLSQGSKWLTAENTFHFLSNGFLPALKYYDRSHSTFGKGLIQLSGPSFSLKMDAWYLGLITGVQMTASAASIPEPLGYWNNYEIPGGVTYDLHKGRASGLLWSNVGIHISRKIVLGRTRQLSVGVNLNYLNAHHAWGIQNHGVSRVRKIGRGQVLAVEGRGTVMLSDPWKYGEPFRISNTGQGFSVDIGFIYRWKGSRNSMPFEWGASISNLGRIKLDKATTKIAEIDLDHQVLFSTAEFEESGFHPMTAFNVFHEKISNEQNVVQLYNGGIFYTPSSLNTYLRLPLHTQVSLHFNWQQNLFHSYQHPATVNYLSITPSFTVDQFEISVPVSWMNYRQVWGGLALRMGPLVIGSDCLSGSIFNAKQMNAASIYLGLKLNSATFPFKTAWWPGNQIECPDFKF